MCVCTVRERVYVDICMSSEHVYVHIFTCIYACGKYVQCMCEYMCVDCMQTNKKDVQWQVDTL